MATIGNHSDGRITEIKEAFLTADMRDYVNGLLYFPSVRKYYNSLFQTRSDILINRIYSYLNMVESGEVYDTEGQLIVGACKAKHYNIPVKELLLIDDVEFQLALMLKAMEEYEMVRQLEYIPDNDDDLEMGM